MPENQPSSLPRPTWVDPVRVSRRLGLGQKASPGRAAGYMALAPPNASLARRLALGPNGIVGLGGCIGLVGYAALAYWSRFADPGLATFFTLIGWVSLPWLAVFAYFRHHPDKLSFGHLVLWAVLFRVCGLFGVPLFEDDYFRYLWDGYRFAETGTPYGWMPAASFADVNVPELFQRILDHINHPDLPTIYGPTTEFAFLLGHLVSPASLIPLQLILIGVDVLLIRLLRRAASPAFVLLYAWCPLVIKEIAFTAHPDGLGVCLLIAAVLVKHRGQAIWAAALLALAVGAKVFALLLVPFVLMRAGARAWVTFIGVLAGLYLPFVVQGGTETTALAAFASGWEFNAALFALVTVYVPPSEAKFLIGAGLVALGGAYWLRYRRQGAGQIPRGDWVFGLFLLAAPVINPWYALWVLPFAAIHPSRWAWTASTTLFLAYVTAINLGHLHLDPFSQPTWVRPVEFGLVLGALLIDIWRRVPPDERA